MFTQKTKVLVTAMLLCSSLTTQSQPKSKTNISAQNVYAGIEVGSKGVKMSLVEKVKKKEGGGTFNILHDTSLNTDFITFDQKTFDETLNALTILFLSAINDSRIPSSRIFTVISSGVKAQAEKEKKTDRIVLLIDEFRKRIAEPDRKVEVVDVMMEAKLSHLGIVPENRRYKTFLIDIGSGNTKGGFFPYASLDNFYLFQVNWGTKSTANATEKLCDQDKSVDNYSKQLVRVMTGAENNDIIYAVNASGAYPLSDYVAFSGGIAWSVATLMYPELINNTIVPVTYEEVEAFIKRLYNGYSSLKDDVLLAKVDETLYNKEQMKKEVKRVHSVFDQKSLMAGSALLLKIMRQFKSATETKQFFLVKNGQVGWISAYVDASSE